MAFRSDDLTRGDGSAVAGTPAPAPASFDLSAAIAAANAANGAAGPAATNPAIVPLWETRPELGRVQNYGKRDSSGDSYHQSLAVDTTTAPTNYHTVDDATGTWLDLPQDQRDKFAQMADRAGLLSGHSPADIHNAWSQAVAMAAKYNGDKTDQGKWISPWEAISKLALQTAAVTGGAYNGFVGTRTSEADQAHVYSADDIHAQADSVLRQKFGRKASKSELEAYAAAVTQASANNPDHTITRQTTDASGNTSQSSTVSGGVDPTQLITDQAQNDPEAARYQAAGVYLPALFAALSAPV